MANLSPNIDSIISDAATNNGVDPDTMRAIASIESGGNPNAVTDSPEQLTHAPSTRTLKER